MSGKIDKYKNDNSLLGQAFVKNPDVSVGQLLRDNNAQVDGFMYVVMGEEPIIR